MYEKTYREKKATAQKGPKQSNRMIQSTFETSVALRMCANEHMCGILNVKVPALFLASGLRAWLASFDSSVPRLLSLCFPGNRSGSRIRSECPIFGP